MSVEAIDALVPAARADNSERVTALVRAIRRAHPGDQTVGGSIVNFQVRDIYDFARRLVEQGVRAPEDAA